MKNYRIILIVSLLIVFTYFGLKLFKNDSKNVFFQPEKKDVKAYAAISVNLDTNLDFYLFYLPITCLSWRLVNYEPIIIAVVTNKTQSNKLAQKTLEYLEYFKFRVIFMESIPNYEKMTGMIARLFIGLVDNISDEEIIFQTDSDLLPMNKTYYQRFDNSDSIKIMDVSSFQTPIGGFNYKSLYYRMFFMGHIGMKKRQWFKVMNFEKSNYKFNGESILNLVREFFGESRIKTNQQIVRGDSVWFLDQLIIAINIGNFIKQDPVKNKIYENLSPGIKLDRVWDDEKWLDTFKNKYDLINDVHLFHENFIDKLHLMDLLFTKMFKTNQKNIIDKYIKEFLLLKNSI